MITGFVARAGKEYRYYCDLFFLVVMLSYLFVTKPVKLVVGAVNSDV